MPATASNARPPRTGLRAAVAVASLLAACGIARADTITPGVDGPVASARINSNWKGLFVAPSGEVMIADSGNNLIRRLSADRLQVTTVAGTLAAGVSSQHYADGNGPAAKFALPSSVAVDAAGNIYVADSGNHVVRKINTNGDVTTLAGQPGVCGIQDGVGQAATLCSPSSIVVDAAGTVYVSHTTQRAAANDPPISGRIRKITADGVVSTFVSATSKYSSQVFAFNPDRAFASVILAIDSAGTLYSADSNDHVIRKYAADGQATVVSGAEGSDTDTEGDADGPAGVARFGRIVDMAFDRQGRLFVLDRRDWVTRFLNRQSIRRVDADGSVTTVIRSPDNCETVPVQPSGVLCGVRSMAVGPQGEFLVGELARDANNSAYMTLRSYTGQGMSTVAIGPGAVAPGVTAAARMDGPATDTRLQIDVSGVPAVPGQQLWLAMLHNSQLLFVDALANLVPFQCPGYCDAPANRAAAGNPQRIEYLHWDVRGLIGAKLYIGWGRSFAEMVEAGQIREVHTVAAQP